MSPSRLPDYIGHIQQAALDALAFVEGMDRQTVMQALPQLLLALERLPTDP